MPSEMTSEVLDLSSQSHWDVAVRYHEFKTQLPAGRLADQVREISASAILKRARQILGSVVHPTEEKLAPWSEVPPDAEQLEIDLEETFENSFTSSDVWMNYTVHRRQPILLSVDTSLSMTGEKLALTAVALAVVLLQFPNDFIGIVAFENEAQILKNPEEKISIEQLVQRFLDVPAKGYTHLEAGLKKSLQLVNRVQALERGRPPSTILLTDGKYTAGRDPSYLASRFPHLVVIKMGSERASLNLCKELANRGGGSLREIAQLEELPKVMYQVVKSLF